MLVLATIQCADGRTLCGMAEVITTSSGAQATNPVECAETSGVGRALAAPVPVVLGAQSIAGGGLWALSEVAWERADAGLLPVPE